MAASLPKPSNSTRSLRPNAKSSKPVRPRSRPACACPMKAEFFSSIPLRISRSWPSYTNRGATSKRPARRIFCAL